MDDIGLEVEVVETGKINMCIAGILEVVKNAVMHGDNNDQGDLQLPVLVGDEEGGADKGDEVHFKEAMHLVDILGHKDGQDRTQHILVKIGVGKKPFYGIVGDKR